MDAAGTLNTAPSVSSQYFVSQTGYLLSMSAGRIPYGSKVVFPDAVCTAVDTGTAIISRKAARLCGRTASQLKAIVVDRFFETKREANGWSNAHSEFMMLRVVPAGSAQN